MIKQENHGGNLSLQFAFIIIMRTLSRKHADFCARVLHVEDVCCVFVIIDCWRAEAGKLNLAGEERMRLGQINVKQKNSGAISAKCKMNRYFNPQV
jgi:hypothetical protein